jgi:hypothetical protein
MSAENGSFSEIECSHSWTEASTVLDKKQSNKSYVSEFINDIAGIFNLPYEVGSSYSSSFDDDTINTQYTSKYDRSLSPLKKNRNEKSKTPLLCYSDAYSSSFDSEDTRRQYWWKDDESEATGDASLNLEYESTMAQLYKAIDTKNWETAYRWLRAKPYLASKWVYRKDNSSGKILWTFLPLHAACFSGTPASLIKHIIHAYPKGLNTPSKGGKLPLHIACETAAGDDVIHCIARGLPSAVNRRDDNGNTPLQLCEKSMKGRRQKKILKMLKGIADGKESRFVMTSSVRHK